LEQRAKSKHSPVSTIGGRESKELGTQPVRPIVLAGANDLNKINQNKMKHPGFRLMLPLLIFSMTLVRLEAYSLTEEPVRLENPLTEAWLKAHIRRSTPRLILTPSKEKILKQKIKTDPVVRNYYSAIKLNASKIVSQDLLKRELTGRRLLGVSREMLYRMNILSMVYRMEKDPVILKRIVNEVTAVCLFSDWNPSHYLDVAEMSVAVAIALDWTGNDWPADTRELALKTLIEKGIQPSYSEKEMSWIKVNNNWNQVCHGGMIAASLAIAGKDPALAARTIARALEGMPYALQEYAPDGVYPEGTTYWSYGTSFSVVTSSMLSSALGTDFGLAQYPAFLKSADFRLLTVAPSGWYFNFSDCGDRDNEGADITLAWFAAQTGNQSWIEKEKLLLPPASMGKLPRLAGAGLVWLSDFTPLKVTTLPLTWKGEGSNPIVIFRGGENDPHQYYFGGKGGKANNNHGNMDAGSFIFELNGVRWSVDPGNQGYNQIEQTGFDLWGRCQDCQRWLLLTKNNFGHSTLTINHAPFRVEGFVPLINFKEGDVPEATFDLTSVYGGNIQNATRRFVRENNHSLLIEDRFILNKNTEDLTWQMITTADMEITKGGAVLRQDEKKLQLEILDQPELSVSVISLDPPPFYLDRKIDGLKRIEIRLPAYLFKEGNGTIRVRLSAKE